MILDVSPILEKIGSDQSYESFLKKQSLKSFIVPCVNGSDYDCPGEIEELENLRISLDSKLKINMDHELFDEMCSDITYAFEELVEAQVVYARDPYCYIIERWVDDTSVLLCFSEERNKQAIEYQKSNTTNIAEPFFDDVPF